MKKRDRHYLNIKINTARFVDREERGPRLPKGEAGLRNIYCHTRTAAKRRGIFFDLTLEQFKNVVHKNCFYCGKKPNRLIFQTAKTISHKTRMWGATKVNGIDRINNDLGYTVKNSRPCCKQCNYLRYGRTVKLFKHLIKRIYEHWIAKND